MIGKLFSTRLLGLFTQADRIVTFPARNLCLPIGRVLFPLFSSFQDDKAHLKRSAQKIMTAAAMLHFPVMIGLAVVAKPLVLVLLTEKWLAAVPYIQLFCVADLLYPYHVINLQILMAQGRSDLFFRLEIYKKLLITAAVAVTVPWGITAMIYGQIATSVVGYYINSYYTGKLISYPALEQIRDFLPTLAISLAMGVVTYLVGCIPLRHQAALLASQVFVGAVTYAALCSLAKIASFSEIIALAQNRQ